MKRIIAIFDFDKTLTDKDTIILLWEYAIKNKKVSKFIFYRSIIQGSLNYLAGFKIKHFKSSICRVFRYLGEEDLEDFVNYVYESHMLEDGLEYLENIEADYFMLVSASPINYLKYFKSFLKFDVIIGTELDESFNIKGENNRSTEKVERILNHLSSKGIEIDYDNSSAFSDSYNHDRPMMELVKNRYLINSNKSVEGYKNLYWK